MKRDMALTVCALFVCRAEQLGSRRMPKHEQAAEWRVFRRENAAALETITRALERHYGEGPKSPGFGAAYDQLLALVDGWCRRRLKEGK
jgi:hypothetical protein